MKNRKIVLLCASTLLLSGCGLVKVKTPKNMVSLEIFQNSLDFVVKTNNLFLPDENSQAYSFELKMYGEGEQEITKKSISNNVLNKEETEIELEGTAKFDSVNSILSSESETKTEVESNGVKSKKTEKTKTQTQAGSNCVVNIDFIANTYRTIETDNIFEYIHSSAKSTALSYTSLFLSKLDEKASYYIDGNRYTIVLTSSSSSDSIATEEKVTFQLTIDEDSLVIAMTGTTSTTTIGKYWTYTTSTESVSVELTRKNVSLKMADTTKMVDTTTSPSYQYGY